MKAQMAAATALAPSSAELVGRIRARDDSVWHDLIDQYEPSYGGSPAGTGYQPKTRPTSFSSRGCAAWNISIS